MIRTLLSLKQAILILIVIAAGVLPLYGQQSSQTHIFKAAAEANQDGSCVVHCEDKGIRWYVVLHRRSPKHPLSGVRVDRSKIAQLEFIDGGEIPAVEATNPGPFSATHTQTHSLRYRAGEPAIPVKRLTPDSSAEVNQKQSASDPYVFPRPKERFNRYLKSMFGPSALIRSAVAAGINQWQDSPEEWEQGMSGYGKRFGSSFGRNAIHHTIVYGMDSMLGLDTGFKRSGSKEFGARLKHALLENITSRTKSGKRVFSVPRVVGWYGSGVITREAWYPERYGWKDGLRSGTDAMLMGFVLNIAREFVVKF